MNHHSCPVSDWSRVHALLFHMNLLLNKKKKRIFTWVWSNSYCWGFKSESLLSRSGTSTVPQCFNWFICLQYLKNITENSLRMNYITIINPLRININVNFAIFNRPEIHRICEQTLFLLLRLSYLGMKQDTFWEANFISVILLKAAKLDLSFSTSTLVGYLHISRKL